MRIKGDAIMELYFWWMEYWEVPSDRMTFDVTRIAGLTIIGNTVNKIQPATQCIVINNNNSK